MMICMILILLSYLRYQVDFNRMDVNSIVIINAYGESPIIPEIVLYDYIYCISLFSLVIEL